MPTPLLDSLLSSGECVLYIDARAGHLLDLSTYGNDGVPTNVDWQGGGVRFNQATSLITVADAAELRLTEGAMIVLCDCQSTEHEYMISKYDGGGFAYMFYLFTTPRVFMQDGLSGSNIIVDARGSKCIACNFASTETSEIFFDGLSIGSTGAVNTFTTYSTAITIGNDFDGGNQFRSTMYAIVMINRKLTATEHAQLYGELSNMTWPNKVKGRAQGKYGPELVTDGDMEAAGVAAWTAGAAATLTKQTGNAMTGSQVLRVAHAGTANPYAAQTVLTVGTRYRIRGWARGDGTGVPRVAIGATAIWGGTAAATWQRFDVSYTAAATDVRLVNIIGVAGYCEFDDLTATEILVDDTQFKTDWQAHAGDVNFAVAGGQLENTPLTVGSGTHLVTAEAVLGETTKVIENVVAGFTSLDTVEFQESPFLCAYGTWEVLFNKVGAATQIEMLPIASVEGISTAAGQNAYRIFISNTETIAFQLYTAGAFVATLFQSAAAYIAVNTWYRLRLTRRQSDGNFVLYILGGAYTTWTQVGTAANNVHTVSNFNIFDYDAGDKWAWSSLTGQNNYRKLHGVIAP